MPSRILVLEHHAKGHHGFYLQWIVQGLLNYSDLIGVVTLPEVLDHPSLVKLKEREFNHLILIPSTSSSVQLAKMAEGSSLIKRQIVLWQLFRRWYQEYAPMIKPDLVFVPYLDCCLYAISLLGSPFGKTPWSGLTMRLSFHYQNMGVKTPRSYLSTIKKALFFRLLRQPTLKMLLSIDEPLMMYLERYPSPKKKVRLLLEPVDIQYHMDKKKARKLLNLNTHRQIILIYGGINPRKGVAELLSALQAPGFPNTVDVLLAGVMSDGIRNFVQQNWVKELVNHQRLHIINRFLNDNDEAAIYSAVDMVWLGYKHHYGPSGVLIQAGQMGLPVVACETGIIGWQTKRYGLGVLISPSSISSVTEGVRRLTLDEEFSRACSINGQRAFANHSIANAVDTLCAAFSKIN